ncbi:MAG: DUF1592 domain-containing protein [Polyangiaceae bacterium]
MTHGVTRVDLTGWARLSVLCSTAAIAACVGRIGDGSGDTGGSSGPGGDPPGTTTSAFTCDGSLTPDALPLRRLSKLQYENTLRDLLVHTVGDEADAVFSSLAGPLGKMPDDEREGPAGELGGFTRLDQTVHQDHVDAMYEVAAAFGAALTDGARLSAVAGDCAADADGGNDQACLESFVRDFGRRVLRGPVSDEDVAFYAEVAGAPPLEPADWADVIALLLNAPRVLYFVEHGATEVTGHAGLFALDPFEMAARLSYHFWQTTPDDELLAAAESGELATEDGYQAQVDRLFADPRTRQAVEGFFAEWLQRKDIDELDSRLGTPVYDAFVDGYLPGPDLREHMYAELGAMAGYYVFDEPAAFDALYESDRSFATTADLAELYGVEPWDGAGEPPQFPDAERVGLLTRAAMLATGSANTRPIMKGVFIRKALLCDHIPPPPNNAAASPPALSGTYTTREVVEQLTENEGTACAACHPTFINPLGFATESFDALGRWRATQRLLDPETGELLDERPVDTTSVPRIVPEDDRPSTGAADVSRFMLESEKPQACFARHWFRFTFGRAEDGKKDGCLLGDLHAQALEGKPLAEVLRAVAVSPAFRERNFEEVQP